MYGKYFQSTFTGSMYGAGLDVFAVWGYVIAHVVDGLVELNPFLLASTLGTSPEIVEKAIEKLCAPDPRSRNKDEDGRRLLREGEFAYRVVNHPKYSGIANEKERREYLRDRKRDQRARDGQPVSTNDVNTSQQVSTPVNNGQQPSTMSTHTDTDTNTNTNAETRSVRAFVAPTVEEVQAFIERKRIANVEAYEFCSYWETRGWMVAPRVKMRNWKAAVCNLESKRSKNE